MWKKSQANYQGFNIKSFSLLEMIIVLLLISIIGSFIISKFNQTNEQKDLISLKSQLALIQEGISKSKNKNILLSNVENIENLDNASINKKDEKLFTNVIDFSIISTNSNEKKSGNWSKNSINSYIFYLGMSPILFSFENESFVCKSEIEICKEIE